MTDPRKHKIVRILRYGNPAWGAKTAHGWLTWGGDNPEALAGWLEDFERGETYLFYTKESDIEVLSSGAWYPQQLPVRTPHRFLRIVREYWPFALGFGIFTALLIWRILP